MIVHNKPNSGKSEDPMSGAVLSLLKAKEGLLEARNVFRDFAESSPSPGEILKYYSYGLSLSETIGRINGLLGSIKDDYPTDLKKSRRKN